MPDNAVTTFSISIRDGKEVRCNRFVKEELQFCFDCLGGFLYMEERMFEMMMKQYADLKIAEARKEQGIEPTQRSSGSSAEVPRSEGGEGSKAECIPAEPSGDPKYRINDYDDLVRRAIQGADVDKRCA